MNRQRGLALSALMVWGVDVYKRQGKELCHYFLEVRKVRDYLSEIG